VATVAIPTRTSLDVSPNVRVTPGVTNASLGGSGVELGDYTGLDAAGGIAVAAFADNSNTTGDNPDGTHADQDIYVARLQIADATVDGAAGSFRGDGLSALLQGGGRAIRGGRAASLSVTLKDAAGLSLEKLGSLSLSDDTGESLALTVTRRAISADLRTAVVSMKVMRPDGASFSVTDNAVYHLTLSNLTDRLGQVTALRSLGNITVNVRPPIIFAVPVVTRVFVAPQPSPTLTRSRLDLFSDVAVI
jgi:hypothetical protein